ncbi:hypothetical protein [Cellulomonas sp. PhB143]|uniref:hypothetical protein n=1 Tax=Cellulomonas sp. PhB143 TaxID=2485186 RepID=UPI000F469637|nr:hypothetical protein [Cellulomonas sp. PhB143]ROS76758.1 hypothetical protein EDF32_1583 [Cellulomonas sp. PhB143]
MSAGAALAALVVIVLVGLGVVALLVVAAVLGARALARRRVTDRARDAAPGRDDATPGGQPSA